MRESAGRGGHFEVVTHVRSSVIEFEAMGWRVGGSPSGRVERLNPGSGLTIDVELLAPIPDHPLVWFHTLHGVFIPIGRIRRWFRRS